jgi:membrane fusion protein, multidrug efflux system
LSPTDPTTPRPHGVAMPTPSHDDEIGGALPEPAEISPGRLVAVAVLAALVLCGLFLAAYVPKRRERAQLEAAARVAERATRRVEVVSPKALSSDRALSLPGNVKPLEETVLYSRASGFVKDWKVDIGEKVQEGQLLAEIETPELDQELAQARAQLAQAEAGIAQATANRVFSQSTLDRYKKLVSSGVATQQDLDQKGAQAEVDLASVNVAKAMVGTQRANLARLGQLKSFARVVAPFSGTITARMVDRGALVSPGAAAPLFRLAALDPMRVFVDVPQDVAPSVHPGVSATVTVREYPGRAFEGKVARTAGALDAASRTLSTEVRVPNGDGALLAGIYAEVRLTLTVPHQVLELPATAILPDARGVRVQLVGPDGVVHLVPVVIERDLGTTVSISNGVAPGDRVVKLASAELSEGMHVDVAR